MPVPAAVSRFPVGSSASNSGRLADDGAGDGDPLPFAAGQLVGTVVEPMAEPDPVQRGRGQPAPLPARHPGVQQPVGHVVQGGHAAGQMELLEHEPDGGGPQRGQLAIGQPGHIVAGDQHGAGGRPVEGPDEIEQSGLTRTGWPDHGRQFARPHGQVGLRNAVTPPG